jgi:exonuclease-1
MGIQGLLPNLKSVTQRIHVSQLKGKNVAVDAYCLLHKGAYTCARELVEGIDTDKYVVFCMSRIEMLVRHGVVPYVVFDGGPLPNKKEEEDARGQGRREQREKARRLWAEGSKAAAMECYQRAVDITPEIANGLVQVGVCFCIYHMYIQECIMTNQY